MIRKRKKKGTLKDSVAESHAKENDREDVADELLAGDPSVTESTIGEGSDRGRDSADCGFDDANQAEDANVQELEEARGQIEEIKEQYLRARAEADNIRKRAETEITNARKFALEGFARELLSVKDSLELARSVNLEFDSSDNSVVAKVAEGLDLTLKQMETVFDRFLIEEINPNFGDKLDPEQHQAMSTEESAEIEPNGISRVIQKGYRLHNRLLRPAMVIVAKAPENA